MKAVRLAIKRLDLSGEEQPTASRRWLGRGPDGPGAEPLGKDFTPLTTTLCELHWGRH